MKIQWLLRECFSVISEGELHLKQLSQLVSTIPVSVGICMFGVYALHINSLNGEVSLAGHTCLCAHVGGACKERGSVKNTYGVNGQVLAVSAELLAEPIRLQSAIRGHVNITRFV